MPDVRDLERRVRELQNCLDKCWRNFLAQARAAAARALGESARRANCGSDCATRNSSSISRKETLVAQLERRAHPRTDPPNERLLALKAHNPARELAARRQRLQETRRRLQASARDIA